MREAAASRAAAERRRRQFALAGIVALAVIGVVVAAIVWRGADKSGNDSGGSPTVAGPVAPKVEFPALAEKPATSKGTGELTKLVVTPLVEGTGPPVQAGQTLSVNYVGVSYKTGEEFDSSWKRSQPFSFKVGEGNVIKGWDQGLVGVKVGSRVQLDIPAELAYGNDASGGGPTGPLRFIVDVLSAK